MILKQSVGYVRVFKLVQANDHTTGKTGQTPTVTISKAGAAFAAAGGAVAEISSGFYKITLSATDTNTLGNLAFHITSGGSPTDTDPCDFIDEVRANIVDDITITSGAVSIASNIKKNQALTGFMFLMTDDTDHVAATGLTVTAQRSLDGAGFSPCANSVSELSNGIYKINLATTDTNGNFILYRFTATGADDKNIPIITQP